MMTRRRNEQKKQKANKSLRKGAAKLYENAFNKIERDLRAEEGIANELDYVEQTSWVLFLKYLHDLEAERADRAELDGDDYTPIIAGAFRWDEWAAPKANGEFDHNTARIGDDLITFVDQELFPYLAAFRQSATSPDTIQYKIGEVFTELRNKFRSGYILRDVLEAIDSLSFNTQAERHELSQLYEMYWGTVLRQRAALVMLPS